MENFKQYLILRGSIYRMIASAFYKEPAQEDFVRIQKYSHVLNTIGQTYSCDEICSGLYEIDTFFREHGTADEAVSICERLFANLFLSAGFSAGAKSVVPQESVYLSPNRQSMQEQRDQVLEVYYKHGYGKQEGFSEPEDHVSAELYFMACLSDRLLAQTDSAKETLNAINTFLSEHIEKWVPAMCRDLASSSNGGYYCGIAKITAGFIAADKLICNEGIALL